MADKGSLSDRIPEIKNRLPILDLIQSYGIELKKQGKELIGLCPFHDDHKHPNLHITPAKNLWNCFVCNSGGDQITFVERIEDISRKDAIENLAERVGLGRREIQENENYLKKRGLTEEIIKKHGLVEEKTRVKIPYYNHKGEIEFYKIRKKYPKNKDDRFYYDPKGIELKLYNHWSLGSYTEYVIITAGEIDCLSLLHLEFQAVGCPGEGLFKEEWIKLFDRFKAAYVCFDGDTVGREKATKIARLLGPKAHILDLPDGKDVNDLLVGGKDQAYFHRLIGNCKSVAEIEFANSPGKALQVAAEVPHDTENVRNMIIPSPDLRKIVPPGGWIRKYYDIMSPAMDAPKIFHLVSGLCTVAAAIGNRVWIGDVVRKVYPNLFCVILSPSGSGRKSTTVASPRIILSNTLLFEKSFLLPDDFSVEALGKEFNVFNERVIVSNEFKATLDVFKRQYNKEGLSKLVDLFDYSRWSISRAAEETKTTENIALTILGASTAEWLLSALHPDGYQAGLWVRFLFCLAERTEFKPDPSFVEEEIMDLGADLANMRANIQGPVQADFCLVKGELEKFAYEAEELGKELGRDQKGSLLSGAAERLSIYAKKISVLYAISESGHANPTPEQFLRACELLRYLFDCHRYIVEMELCFSGIEKKRKNLYKVILANPGITKSMVTRKSQDLDSRTRDQLLNELEAGKWIRSEKSGEGKNETEKFYSHSYQ